MKNVICDGWHVIGETAVYTENGVIKRATKEKGGVDVSAAVYKSISDRSGFYTVNVMPCNYTTFRRGLLRGNYMII